ncbi:hypothetical protein DER46DRAFT_595915 [Fusarium sp. MPI-SDFR-AT-0072]|nr:hypothetical protein DER46DRAFT_595915 [Fusarium sp. MPI-SDFR-AT-0072]
MCLLLVVAVLPWLGSLSFLCDRSCLFSRQSGLWQLPYSKAPTCFSSSPQIISEQRQNIRWITDSFSMCAVHTHPVPPGRDEPLSVAQGSVLITETLSDSS